jgi:hypothetical protein
MNITYYSSVKMQRQFPLEQALLKLIYNILSIPKMALEVFSRKSFGERYFSPLISIVGIIILAVLPTAFPTTDRFVSSIWEVVGANMSWYLYLAGFTTMCVLRYLEILHEPSVFDFAKHSLFDGEHQEWFKKLVLDRFGKLSPRTIDIWVEPGFYLLLGIVLVSLQFVFIGAFIILCALCYMLANQISYSQGDHMIMDWIDRLIEAEQFERFFVDNRPTSETKGFKVNGRRPVGKKMKQAVAKLATSSTGDLKDKTGQPVDWDWMKKNAFDDEGNPSLNYFNKM